MTNTITINLNIFERKFLIFLSFNGGVLGLDHERMTNDVSDALKTLIIKGAITKTQLSGTSKHEYRLTTIGSNLVDLIKDN